MSKIFISYRRADSRKDAGRIYDRLVEAFGKENVFKDVDNIPMGTDFRGVLREAVAQCKVQLVIIGKSWLTITDENINQRLHNPSDFVRIEVETALQRSDSCIVIPVLVDNASMPNVNELPLELRELAFKNATVVRDDPDFHGDITKIIQRLGGGTTRKRANTTATFNVNEAIGRFYSLFDERRWDEARALLAEIRASGKAPKVFNIDTHEQEIWAELEAEERDREYEVLRMMARRAKPTGLWEALQVFWQSYPDYDPDSFVRFKPTLMLPKIKSESIETLDEMLDSSAQVKRLVCIIEDDQDMAYMFKRIIEEEGYEILLASNLGEIATILAIYKLEPSIIIMNIKFRKHRSWEIMKRIKDRTNTQHIPVIMMSERDEGDKAMKAGAFDFIRIPVSISELRGAIKYAEIESRKSKNKGEEGI
jgi:CheY-like chemotaxis protein